MPPKSGFRSGVRMDLDDRRFLNLTRTEFRHEPLFLDFVKRPQNQGFRSGVRIELR